MISIKKGEAKDIKFTYTSNDTAIDVSANTFRFEVKKDISDTSPVFVKADGDFDKTDAADGIVYCNINTTDSNNPVGEYIAEIRMIATVGTDVDKSDNIDFIIEEAVM